MSKASWKYKRVVNQFFYSIRNYPRLCSMLTAILFQSRRILRLGKKNKQDLKVEKLINNNVKFIYAANPKVATRSMYKLLQSNYNSQLCIKHKNFDEIYTENREAFNYFHFTFVRNPWARVYSCWKDKISTENKFCDIFIITKHKGLYPDMPFDHFVEWLLSNEGSDATADRHWMSQVEVLGIEYGIKYDFIGKIEELSTFETELFSKIGLSSCSLEVKNSSLTKQDEYKNVYTRDLIQLVYKRYKNDVDKFGYNF